MKILALDTSTPRVTVALVDGETVLRRLSGGELVGGQFHGEWLASLIQECLDDVRPDAIAIGRGPGPYTGLRVGIVTGEVLAMSWEIPVIGVSTLAAIAHGYRRRGGGECVAVLDVKRREIAWQAFNADGTEVAAAGLVAIADFDSVATAPVVGPAFVTQTLVTPKVVDASPVDAVDIALLARSIASSDHVRPLYLREPDAAEPAKRKSVING